MELSPSERDLCAALGFQPFVAQLLKNETRVVFRQLLGFDLEQEKVVPIVGLSALFGPLHKAKDEEEVLVKTLNAQIILLGYRAFRSDAYEIGNVKFGREVAIVKTNDSLDFVRIKATCAPNFDIEHTVILDKLQDWHKKFGLSVLGAASDWVEFKFHSLPKEICRFAEEVYEFCPDSVEQGIGLLQEAEDPEFFREARQLCGGISDEMKQKILDDYVAMDDEEFSEAEIDAIVAETEMGILLLANYIKTYQSLFLWWD